MSRSRKRKANAAGQRRQEEIQKRIGRAAENAEKKKAKDPVPAPEKEPEPVTMPAATAPKKTSARAVMHKTGPDPEQGQEARPSPEPRTKRGRTRMPRPEPVFPTSRRILSISGDGSVTFPARTGLSDLFKAIRNDFPSGEAFLYINLDPGKTARDSYGLSYIYHNGLFNRKEAMDGKSIPKDAPLLADILDARVLKVSVDLDGDWAEWFVDAKTSE